MTEAVGFPPVPAPDFSNGRPPRRRSDTSSSEADVRSSSADRRSGAPRPRYEPHIRRRRPANYDGRSYSSNPHSRGAAAFADSWKRSGSVDETNAPQQFVSSTDSLPSPLRRTSDEGDHCAEGGAKALARIQAVFLGGLLLSLALGSCLHSVKLRSLRFVSSSQTHPEDLASGSAYSFLQPEPFPLPLDGERCAEQHQHEAFPSAPHIPFRHEFMRNSFLLFSEIGPFDRLYLVAKEPRQYNLADALPSDPFPIIACNYPLWRNALTPFKKVTTHAVKAWLPSLSGCCGFEKNTLIIQQAGRSSLASRIPTPDSPATASVSKEINALQRMFAASNGFLSPCYCLARQVSRYVTGAPGYIPLVVLWTHSLLSPRPLTMVHVPRLLLYAAFAVYRYVFLYLGVNFVERRISEYDLSDHVVLYVASTLYLSVEYVAMGCSHPGMVRTASGDVAGPEENNFLPRMAAIVRSPKKLLLTIIFPSICFVNLFAIWYSALITAAFFHHRREVFTGVLVGAAGSYGVFWLIVVWLGAVSLDRIGLVPHTHKARRKP